jgi:hypothetical protein
MYKNILVIIIILILLLFLKHKCYELFTDFDDVMDTKCNTLNNKNEYIWDEKKCGPKNCPLETCLVLRKNPITNMYEYVRQRLVQKKKRKHLKHDEFECETNTNKQKNIYCGDKVDSKKTCSDLHKTQECYDWNEDSEEWDKLHYKKYMNENGNCLWYNLDDMTTKENLNDCVFEKTNCSKCNISCGDLKNYKTYKYDKTTKQCVVDQDCSDSSKCSESMVGYVYNAKKNRYEKKKFLPVNDTASENDECVYAYNDINKILDDTIKKWCHPINFNNSLCITPADVRDIVNQDAIYFDEGGRQFNVETTDCSTLPTKRCSNLDKYQQLVQDKYSAELSIDRTKCIFKNNKEDVKELSDECNDFRNRCSSIDQYVDIEEKKCMECPTDYYLKDASATLANDACSKVYDKPDDDWCWTPMTEYNNLEEKKTYPYKIIYSQSDNIRTHKWISDHPYPCKKDCDSDRIINNSITNTQYCDTCHSSIECLNKCEPANCVFNANAGKCECTKQCTVDGRVAPVGSTVQCINNDTNKYDFYKVEQENDFSDCRYVGIGKNNIQETLNTCSQKCSEQGYYKITTAENGSYCAIPECEIDIQYHYTTWDDQNRKQYNNKNRKGDSIETLFRDFNVRHDVNSAPSKCEFDTLTRVIRAKGKYPNQTQCIIDGEKTTNSELIEDLIDNNIIYVNINDRRINDSNGLIIATETKTRREQGNLCDKNCELEIVNANSPDTICRNLGNSTYNRQSCYVNEDDANNYNISTRQPLTTKDNISFKIISPHVSGGKKCMDVALDVMKLNAADKNKLTIGEGYHPHQTTEVGNIIDFWYNCDLDGNRCPLDCVKEPDCPEDPICTLSSDYLCRGTYTCGEKIKYPAIFGGKCTDGMNDITDFEQNRRTSRIYYRECNTCDDQCVPEKDEKGNIKYELWHHRPGQHEIKIDHDENKFNNWDSDATYCGEGTLTKKQRATTKCLDPMSVSTSPAAIHPRQTYITSELDTKTAMSCSERETTIINYINEIIQIVDTSTTSSELSSLDDAIAMIITEYPSIAPVLDEIRAQRAAELRKQEEIISNQEYKNELCPLEFHKDEIAYPLVSEIISPLRPFDDNNADLIKKVHQIGKYYNIPFESFSNDRQTYCYARAAANMCLLDTVVPIDGLPLCPDACKDCSIIDMEDVAKGKDITHCPPQCKNCMNDPCSAECSSYHQDKSLWHTWEHKRVFTPTGITDECGPSVEEVGNAEPVKDKEEELEQQPREEPLGNSTPQDYNSFFMECNEDGKECRQYRRATCVNGTLNGHKNSECDGSGCPGYYYTTLTPNARERTLQIDGGYFQVLDNGDLIHSTGRNTSEKQVANIFHRMVRGAYIADTARNEWLNTTETNEMIAIYEFKDQERRPLLRDVNRIKLWNANTGDYFAGNVKIFIWDTGYYSGEKKFIPVTNPKYSTNTQGFSTPPRRAELLQIDFDMVLTMKIKIVINKHVSNTSSTFGISYCKIELFNWNDATIHYGTFISTFFYDQFNKNFDKNIVRFNDYIDRTNVNQITIPLLQNLQFTEMIDDELTWQNEWIPPSSSLKEIIERSHRGAMDWWNRTMGEFSDWREESQIVANRNGSEMRANDKIYPPATVGSRTKHYIISDNGCFRLFLKNDGNLVVQIVPPDGSVGDYPTYWRSNTPGTPQYFTLTEKGNLILYNTNDDILWSSKELFGHADGANRLKIENDGTLVLYKDTQIIWKPALFMNGVRVHSLDCPRRHPRAHDIQQCNEQCIDKNIDPTDPYCIWGYEYQYKRGFIWHFIKLYYDWKIPTGNSCYGGLAIDLDGSREAWIIAATGNIDPESDVFDNPYSQDNIWYGNLDLETGDGSSKFIYDTIFEKLKENLDYSIDTLTKAYIEKNNSDYIDLVIPSHEKMITYQREVGERYATVVNDVSDLREKLTASSGLASDLTVVDDKNTNSCVTNFQYTLATSTRDGYWGEDITTISDNIDNKLTIKINKIDYVIDTVKNTINIDVELENKTDKPIYFYALAHNTPKVGSQDFKFIANDNRKYRSLLQKILFINQSKSSNQTFKNHQTKHVIISDKSKNFTFKIHDFIDIKDTIEPDPTSQADEDELKRRLLQSSTNLNYEIKDIDISSLVWITIYADENEPTDFYKTLVDKGLDAMRKHRDQRTDSATLSSLYYTRLVNVLDKIKQVFNFTISDSIDNITSLQDYVDRNSGTTLTEKVLNDGLNALISEDILQELCEDLRQDKHEPDAHFRVKLNSVIDKLDLIYEYCITLDVIPDDVYTKLKDFKLSLDNILDIWYAGEEKYFRNLIGKNKLGFSHVDGRDVGDHLYCDLSEEWIKYDVDVNNPDKMKQDCGYSEDKADQRYSCRKYFKIEDPDSSYNKLERILMNNNYNETYAKLKNNQNRFVILKRILNDPEKLRPCLSSAQIASSDDEYYSYDMRSDTFLNKDSSSQPVVDQQVRVFKEKLEEAIAIKTRVEKIKEEIDTLQVYVNQRFDWVNQGKWHLNPNRDRNQIVGDYIPICNSFDNFDDTYMYFSENNQLQYNEQQWIECGSPLFRKKNQHVHSKCNERKFCDLYMLCNNIEKRVAVDADQQNKLNELKSLCENPEKPEHQGLYIFSKKESCEFHFRKNQNNDFTTLVDLSPTSTNMCDLWYSQLSNNSEKPLNPRIIVLNATTVGKQTQTNKQTKNKLTIEDGRLTSPNQVDDVWVFSVKREDTQIPTTDELQTVATKYTLLADSETYHHQTNLVSQLELNQLSLTKTFSSLDGSETEPITDDGDYWVVVVAKQGDQYHAAYRQTPAPATATDLTDTSYIEWWAHQSSLINDDYGYTESNYLNDWLKDYPANLFMVNSVLGPTHENAIGYSRWFDHGSRPRIINASMKVDNLDWELDIKTNFSFDQIEVQCLIYEYSTYRKMGPSVENDIKNILTMYPENSFRRLNQQVWSFKEIFDLYWNGPSEGNEVQSVTKTWEQHVKDVTIQLFHKSSIYKSYAYVIGDFIWDNKLMDTYTLKFHGIYVFTTGSLYTPLLKSLAKHNVTNLRLLDNPEDPNEDFLSNTDILNNKIWISGLDTTLEDELTTKLKEAGMNESKIIHILHDSYTSQYLTDINTADDKEWKTHFYYFRINSIIPSERTKKAKIKFSDLRKRTETSIFGSTGQNNEFILKPDTKYQMALLSTINNPQDKFKLNFINFQT